MDEKEIYGKRRQAYTLTRPTESIPLPSGLVVVVYRPVYLEFLEAIKAVGGDPEKMSTMPSQEKGLWLLNRATQLLDTFVVPLVVRPKLALSTETNSDQISVSDLVAEDRGALLYRLIEIAGE